MSKLGLVYHEVLIMIVSSLQMAVLKALDETGSPQPGLLSYMEAGQALNEAQSKH